MKKFFLIGILACSGSAFAQAGEANVVNTEILKSLKELHNEVKMLRSDLNDSKSGKYSSPSDVSLMEKQHGKPDFISIAPGLTGDSCAEKLIVFREKQKKLRANEYPSEYICSLK